MTEQDIEGVHRALLFFRSVIRSGEPWTVICDETLTRAVQACDRIRRATGDMKLSTMR